MTRNTQWNYLKPITFIISFMMMVFFCLLITNFAQEFFSRWYLSLSDIIYNSPPRSYFFIIWIVVSSPIFTHPSSDSLLPLLCFVVFFGSLSMFLLSVVASPIFPLSFFSSKSFRISCCSDKMALFATRVESTFSTFISVVLRHWFSYFTGGANFSFHKGILA